MHNALSVLLPGSATCSFIEASDVSFKLAGHSRRLWEPLLPAATVRSRHAPLQSLKSRTFSIFA